MKFFKVLTLIWHLTLHVHIIFLQRNADTYSQKILFFLILKKKNAQALYKGGKKQILQAY